MKDLWLNNKKLIIAIASVIVILLTTGTITYTIMAKNNKQKQADNKQEVQTLDEYAILGDESIAEQFEIPEEELLEDEENKDNKKDNEKDDKQGGPTYLLRVNKSANVVNVYSKDDDGDYTVPVRAMICSTGTYTPSCGKYPSDSYKTTGGKRRWALLQGNVYGQYATQIVGNILFHSVPYTEQDPSALEYWEYDKLGTTASAGCIRLTVADAQWVYNNVSRGTIVEFYYDSNPGPFGKPYAQSVSGNDECRGWDPTDSTDGNPWRGYKEEKKETKKEEVIHENTTKEENTIEIIEKNEPEKEQAEVVDEQDNAEEDDEKEHDEKIPDDSNDNETINTNETINEIKTEIEEIE